VAADGFWVTLAAGAANAPSPSDYSEFSIPLPHAPVVVNQLTGGITGVATTGAGSTSFNGVTTPVLLSTSDGYATITQLGIPGPPGGIPRFTGGPLASAAAQLSTSSPGTNLLSIDWASSGPSGKHVVTVDLTDSNGSPLGEAHVVVPKNGWFIIGLGTAAIPDRPDPPGSGPSDGKGNGNGNPIDNGNGKGHGNGGGTVTTPEPASILLVGVGGLGLIGWRRFRW
jgi:hypothetical protein